MTVQIAVVSVVGAVVLAVLLVQARRLWDDLHDDAMALTDEQLWERRQIREQTYWGDTEPVDLTKYFDGVFRRPERPERPGTEARMTYFEDAARRLGRHRRPRHDAGAAALNRAITREGERLHRAEREAERRAARDPSYRTCPQVDISRTDAGQWFAWCVCSWRSDDHDLYETASKAAIEHREGTT